MMPNQITRIRVLSLLLLIVRYSLISVYFCIFKILTELVIHDYFNVIFLWFWAKCYVKRLTNLKQCCIFSPNNQHLIIFKWTTCQDHCCLFIRVLRYLSAGIAVELAITLILLQFADVSMKNVRVQMLASWRLLEEKTLSISLLLVRTLTCGKSCKRFVTFIKYYIFLMLIPMVRYVFLFNIFFVTVVKFV